MTGGLIAIHVSINKQFIKHLLNVPGDYHILPITD